MQICACDGLRWVRTRTPCDERCETWTMMNQWKILSWRHKETKKNLTLPEILYYTQNANSWCIRQFLLELSFQSNRFLVAPLGASWSRGASRAAIGQGVMMSWPTDAVVSAAGVVAAVHLHILVCLLSSALLTPCWAFPSTGSSSLLLSLLLLTWTGSGSAGPGVLPTVSLVPLPRALAGAWRRVLLFSIGQAVSSQHSLLQVLLWLKLWSAIKMLCCLFPHQQWRSIEKSTRMMFY